MREVTNQVARRGRAELPTRSGRKPGNEVIELASRELRSVFEKFFATTKRHADVTYQPMLVRVVAEGIGAAEIGFPRIKHRAQVEEYDIIGGDAPVAALGGVAEHCIRAGAH